MRTGGRYIKLPDGTVVPESEAKQLTKQQTKQKEELRDAVPNQSIASKPTTNR